MPSTPASAGLCSRRPTGEAELGYDDDELVGTYSLQDREEAWSLGLLLEYLRHHGTELGWGCGGAEWFDRVMLGEADHG